jgi:hypothetical protein
MCCLLYFIAARDCQQCIRAVPDCHSTQVHYCGIFNNFELYHCFRREEREQRRSDIEHLAHSLVNKVNECVTALDDGMCTIKELYGAV